jgi:murein DD-endopeptidase MepM/ murein hydrolase activator NlpD
MAKNKYVFDSGKVNFEKVERNLRTKVLKVLAYLFSSIFLAALLVFIFSFLFDTPRERKLRQEYKSVSEDHKILMEKYERVDTVLKELAVVDQDIYRTIFETEPQIGGSQSEDVLKKYEELSRLSNEIIVENTYDTLNILLTGINYNAIRYQHLLSDIKRKENSLSQIPAIQPIENTGLTKLASGYGQRLHPFYNIKKMHYGIDFTAPVGTDVYATGDGVVFDIDRTSRGHGNTVIIDHGNGYKTIYAHLDGFNVKKGKSVRRGDVIAWVGNSGLSTAPHLHYEVHLNDKAVNPVNYFFLELDSQQYNKLIELSVKSGQSFD